MDTMDLARASMLAASHKSRAKKLGLTRHFTGGELLSLFISSDGRCAKCAANQNITADHITALSKGGSNTIDNIQMLCQRCNNQKDPGGRPLLGKERLIRRGVAIQPKNIEYLKEIGNGSLRTGVQTVLEFHRDRHRPNLENTGA